MPWFSFGFGEDLKNDFPQVDIRGLAIDGTAFARWGLSFPKDRSRPLLVEIPFVDY
ncbi:MAG: hypothetical protein ACK5OC_05535 [Pirellula sp.]